MNKTQIQNRINELKEKIVPILEKYPIKKAGLFGSVTTGNERSDSDIDLLVEITDPKEIGMFGYIQMKFDIEEIVGKKVDLTEYDLVKPHYRKYIIPQEVRIYEKD